MFASFSRYIRQLQTTNFSVDKEIAREMLDWYIKSTQAKISSNELREKSLNSLKESWDNNGEVWLNWKDKGNKTLFDVLLVKIETIILFLKVVNIIQRETITIWRKIW